MSNCGLLVKTSDKQASVDLTNQASGPSAAVSHGRSRGTKDTIVFSICDLCNPVYPPGTVSHVTGRENKDSYQF